MKDLIEIINKMQDVFRCVSSDININLPQIVVVGNQSVGKSSVIESIVRANILPRGSGIVTRCPLVLQLVQCPIDNYELRTRDNELIQSEQWGEFLHKKGEIFTDFALIRNEIEKYTNELAGDGKGVCNHSINLKIFSPNVVNLTLVDLPGFTKVAVADQPPNIEVQLKELAYEFVKNPNSIILAVTAANVDLAVDDSLKFAKIVDPDGERTLVVLTKLDLMDKGTNAYEVLSGNVIPVKLGIIGVVNRCQADLNQNLPITEQLKKEADFLKNNYPDITKINGTRFLEKRLSNLLVDHIKKCLPDLMKLIKTETFKNQETLKILGKVTDKKIMMTKIMYSFAENFTFSIENTHGMDENSDSKLFKIIHHDLRAELGKVESDPKIPETFFDKAFDYNHRPKLIQNPFFDEAFDILMVKKIQKFRDPTVICAGQVREELCRLTKKCKTEPGLTQFPKLREKVIMVTEKLIAQRFDVVIEKIDDIFDIETTYPNKAFMYFDKGSVLQNLMSTLTPGEETLSEMSNLQPEQKRKFVKGFVEDYLKAERIIIQDSVVKTIMCFFIKHIKKTIQTELIVSLLDPQIIEEAMMESPIITEKRDNAVKTLEALDRCSIIVSDISQIDIGSED